MHTKTILLITTLLLITTQTQAKTFKTIKDGPWSAKQTWEQGCIPGDTPFNENWMSSGNGDTIIISHDVSILRDFTLRTPDLLIIEQEGTLSGDEVTIPKFHQKSFGKHNSRRQMRGLEVHGTLASMQLINFGATEIAFDGKVLAHNSLPNYGEIHLEGMLNILDGKVANFGGVVFLGGFAVLDEAEPGKSFP